VYECFVIYCTSSLVILWAQYVLWIVSIIVFLQTPVLCFLKVATYLSDGYIFSHNWQYLSCITAVSMWQEVLPLPGFLGCDIYLYGSVSTVTLGRTDRTIWQCFYSNIRKDRQYYTHNTGEFLCAIYGLTA
jgi:hypothetical protein